MGRVEIDIPARVPQIPLDQGAQEKTHGGDTAASYEERFQKGRADV